MQANQFEPGLGWISQLLNPEQFDYDPAAAQRMLARTTMFRVLGESMTPRFPAGATIGAELLAEGEVPTPGQVLLWHDGAHTVLARLVEVGPDWLRLAADNGGAQTWLCWPGTQAVQVYRVTCYSSYPVALCYA